MFKALMTSRRFAPLFWCQFCSALNDNFLKNALVMLILFGIGGMATATGSYAPVLVTLAGVVFIAPFFILSAIGGELADRYDKAQVASFVKLAEIPIAALAALGFFLHSVPVLFVTLGLFGIIAALFGPVKYGILPEKLETAELPAGNALVEGATFLAILIGTIAGGIAVTSASPELVVGVILALAVASWGFARAIPAAGPAAPGLVITRNVWTSTLTLLREVRADARLWSGAHIVSWFWLVGSVALALLPAMVKDHIGGSEGVVTLGLTTFVIGIAIGSILAARASHGAPNLALVPLGAALIGVCALVLGALAAVMAPAPAPIGPAEVLTSVGGLAVLAALFGLAVAGGLYIVPSFAAVQAWSPPDRRARVIAAVNVMNAAYMVGGGAVVAALQAADVGIGILFAALGVLSLAVVFYVVHAWGFGLLRDLGRLILRFFFRLEVKGLENLPAATERVVFAPNHVSLLDGPLLYTVLPREASFAVNSQIAAAWWVKPFLKVINAYLLEPTRAASGAHADQRRQSRRDDRGLSRGTHHRHRLADEGLRRHGHDRGQGRCCVVPVRIDGLERSAFQLSKPSQIKKALFPKVTVTFLPPRRLALDPALKGRSRRQMAGLTLQDIMVEAAVATAPADRSMFEALAHARATRDTGRPAVADPMGTRLSYRKLMLGAQVLGPKLEPYARPGGAVGVMLPNSVAAAATFFALQAIGRVPAMINFTAGAPNIRASCRAADVSRHPHLAHVRRARALACARRPSAAVRARGLSGGRAVRDRHRRQAARSASRSQAARCPQGGRSRGDPFHVRDLKVFPRRWCCRIATSSPIAHSASTVSTPTART